MRGNYKKSRAKEYVCGIKKIAVHISDIGFKSISSFNVDIGLNHHVTRQLPTNTFLKKIRIV